MTWTKISDEFTDDPQLLALSRDDRLLLVEATVYSNRILSDGHIPERTVRIFTDHPQADKGMAALVDAGLMEVAADGWTIVDFHRHQKSAKAVRESREKTQERVRNWRKRKAEEARNGVTNASRNPSRNAPPDPTRPEGRGGSADAAHRRGDPPPLDKAREAFRPFEIFGQVQVLTDDDGGLDFEIDEHDQRLLIQATVEPDGKITDIWIYLDQTICADCPDSITGAQQLAPHLEPLLKRYTHHDDGTLAQHFEGELNHRCAQIADYVQRLVDRSNR